MRLLTWDSLHGLSLTDDLPDDKVPPYAILSHTWRDDGDEVTFNDLQQDGGLDKAGYKKVRFCGQQASKDKIEYFWVDTCCIDRANNNELTEAINSMYRWYLRAQKCYVYLSDVYTDQSNAGNPTTSALELSFCNSRWFRRGWTLQELLAPTTVEFFSQQEEFIGTKTTLAQQIHEITTIPLAALHHTPLSQFPVAERIRWAQKRETTKKEDQAYCLLGIFDLSMSLVYGEGDNALRRLERKINKKHGADVARGLGDIHRSYALETDSRLNEYIWTLYCYRAKVILGYSTALALFIVLLSMFILQPGTHGVQPGQSSNNTVMNGKQIFHYGPRPEVTLRFQRPLGLCLHQAPYIEDSWFVGRAAEIDSMHQILKSEQSSSGQRRLVLGGIGGIGKTQLAIAYAKQKGEDYSTIFWMDAASEATLKDNFKLILERLLDPRDLEDLSTEQVLAGAKQWLSDTSNTNWLLIFDNYDEPGSYNIKDYYPQAFHGAIIITTRRPDQVEGSRFDIKALGSIEYSLQILQTRSQRVNISDDRFAHRLAERLGGFPLALATAGAYLRRSTWSFEKYLQEYEERWAIGSRRPLQLSDYMDRTLYTSWDLSYQRLQIEDPVAAQMLKLLAYFGHQSLWHELFHAGIHEDVPEWLQFLVHDAIEFDSVMLTLVDYCFVEIQSDTKMYGLHTCVHDWTMFGLNKQIELWSYRYAFDCVARSVHQTLDWKLPEDPQLSRFVPHALRLVHERFRIVLFSTVEAQFTAATAIAMYLHQQEQFSAAGEMYQLLLAGMEKSLGPDHVSTLQVVHKLGALYHYQDKLAEAEQMYIRVLAWEAKALGPRPDHTSILQIISNLGDLYRKQNKLKEAEQMFSRALAKHKEATEPDRISILNIANNLGMLCRDQGKLTKAEKIYLLTLDGYVDELGPNHSLTLNTVNNVGMLYHDQGKLVEAEQWYRTALAGKAKLLGADHSSTLNTVHNLGVLYRDQGKLDKAEEMYARALAGKEKVLGPDHTSTLETVYNLGLLYVEKGKLDLAGQMLTRALTGYRRQFGQEHPQSRAIAGDLTKLRGRQANMDIETPDL